MTLRQLAAEVSDFEFTVERILDWDRLLADIPGNKPSGDAVRNTPAYDQIKDALRPQDTAPGGVWQKDAKAADFRAIIRSATDLLAAKSKDLDVAVWLTEALVRQYGLSGLSEGVLLIEKLLDKFWDGIYPILDPDDGDEGFRAKPIGRLNVAFVGILRQTPIANNGKTIWEYNTSCDVPSEEDADRSNDLRTKREKAITEGAIAPEEFRRSITETFRSSPEFYDEMASEVASVIEAVAILQGTCDSRFTTSDRPVLQKLADQLQTVQLAVSSILALKPQSAKPTPPPQAPVVAREAAPRVEPESSTPSWTEAPREPEIEEQTADSRPAEPSDVVGIAAMLRSDDASNPVPYMLMRSWRFGPMIAKGGSVDESSLEPPSTELKMALRRAWLDNSWYDVLENTERAMAESCGGCWLDLQLYSQRACKELGYDAAAQSIRGLTATYLQAVPDIQCAVMLDGSPTASPDTLSWIRAEVLADPQRARNESLEEVRSVEDETPFEDKIPDAFEVAVNEFNSGRFSEAFRILTEAQRSEQTGRGRLQRKIQLAKICMEAQQYRIALPVLQEINRTIESRNLDQWESPEFVSAPLAMLYLCLEQGGEDEEARRKIYDRICAADPVKALELVLRS